MLLSLLTWMFGEDCSEDDKDNEAKGRNQPPLVVERVNDDKDNEGDDDEAIDDEGEEPAPKL